MVSVAPRLARRPNLALVLDLGERALLLALFSRLALGNVRAMLSTGHWFNCLLILSEGLSLLFVMIRRPARHVSDNPSDWTVALFATAGPLLVHPAGLAPIAPVALGVSLMLLGVATQIAAKLALNLSFGVAPANRGVKRGGPYRYVRHPMYLGYLGVHVGFLLLTPSAWNLAVYGVSTLCQLVRILAEERLLSQDPAYAALQAEVRYRLLPGVF